MRNPSRKFVSLSFFFLAIGSVAIPAYADVTGSFETHIAVRPQSTNSELSILTFDVQNALNLTLDVSGVVVTLHTHFGIAGVEDVIVSASATLGSLDLSLLTVSGRYAFGSTAPFYDKLHFVKQRVTLTLNLGGVTIRNDGQLEDTNAFLHPTAANAFGDVISIEGQTVSGITIGASTGICMEQFPNNIKKHPKLSPWTVNPDCATTPKPDLLFDFEQLAVEKIPLSTGIYVDFKLNCLKTTACALTSLVNVTGTSIPFAVSLIFSDLMNFKFGGANLILTTASGTLLVQITPAGSLGAAKFNFNFSLNPDSNPATLTLAASLTPGVGIEDALIRLAVERLGLTLSFTAQWAGGPPAKLLGYTFALDVPADLLAQARILPGPDGVLQTTPASGSDDQVSDQMLLPGPDGVLQTTPAPGSDDVIDQNSILHLGLETSATFDASGLISAEIFITVLF
ncbi:hypothetical protein HY229_07655 [Candidatus Acetothermia bacterium]|nr:hypothetical protein [Candidatus Acetothermia bacterium]MBI3643953.1 hypothetical protein [Candidatus Acetothermia bacterium]